MIAINLIICQICLILMLQIDEYLFRISLALSALILGITLIISRLNISYDKIRHHTAIKWQTHTLADIRNLETIKSCGLENKALNKYHALFCAKLSSASSFNQVFSLSEILIKTISSLSMLVLMFAGGSRISRGILSIGQLMGYYSLQLFLINILMQMIKSFREFQQAYVANLWLQDLLHQERDRRFLNPAMKMNIHRDSYF